MKKGVLGIILISLVVVVAAITIYYTYFYIKPCPDMICFNEALADCDKRSAIEETESSVWLYEIIGKSSDNCVISIIKSYNDIFAICTNTNRFGAHVVN